MALPLALIQFHLIEFTEFFLWHSGTIRSTSSLQSKKRAALRGYNATSGVSLGSRRGANDAASTTGEIPTVRTRRRALECPSGSAGAAGLVDALHRALARTSKSQDEMSRSQ
jgi:hypothetical protein